MSNATQSLTSALAEPHPTEHGLTESKRILLAEGDGFTRLVLLFRLRLAGFKVDFTSNGILALGKLRSRHPDALLVELKLRGLSGLELIKAARRDPAFGDRPIYVFTRAEQMNRNTRKEVRMLATQVFDKSSVTREELVMMLANMASGAQSAGEPSASNGAAKPVPLSEMVVPGELEGIIAGVREQSKLLARSETAEARHAACAELLSRLRSLSSCAEAAGLQDLARQASALEEFLDQLHQTEQPCKDAALRTVIRAVEVIGALPCQLSSREQNYAQFSAVIVDQEPGSNKAIVEALSHAGFSATSFEDPRSARAHLAANYADLVVANLVLPQAHGLGLADIRQLPLHAQTPVIFAPESSVWKQAREELPTSAPQLNASPLLLKELVIKALNEVQNIDSQAPGAAATPTPSSAAEKIAKPVCRFERARDDSMSQDAAVRLATAPANVSEPISTRLAAPSISSQHAQQSEPGAAGAGYEAELLSKLPATSTDAVQTDDQLIEAAHPSLLQPAASALPKPDQTVEERTAKAEQLATAERDFGEFNPAAASDSEPEANEGPSELQSAAAVLDHGQTGGDQFQALQDDCAQQCEASSSAVNGAYQLEQQTQTCPTQMEGEPVASHQPSEPPNAMLTTEQQVSPDLGEPTKNQSQQLADEEREAKFDERASAQPDEHVKELENGLQQRAIELERAKEDFEQQSQERSQVESGLRGQLEAATSLAAQTEAAHKKAQARCELLEQELARVQRAREELIGKFAQAHLTTPESANLLSWLVWIANMTGVATLLYVFLAGK